GSSWKRFTARQLNTSLIAPAARSRFCRVEGTATRVESEFRACNRSDTAFVRLLQRVKSVRGLRTQRVKIDCLRVLRLGRRGRLRKVEYKSRTSGKGNRNKTYSHRQASSPAPPPEITLNQNRFKPSQVEP